MEDKSRNGGCTDTATPGTSQRGEYLAHRVNLRMLGVVGAKEKPKTQPHLIPRGERIKQHFLFDGEGNARVNAAEIRAGPEALQPFPQKTLYLAPLPEVRKDGEHFDWNGGGRCY